MLRSLLPYWRGGGIDARWLVLQGPPEFFRLTKRLHNMLYGYPAGTRLRPGDNELFEHVARVASAQGAQAVAPGDVVVLEDPQTASLAPLLRREGALIVWRCHVGADRPNEHTEAAWSFLRPYIERAEAFVFTRRAFVPPGLDPERVRVLPPAIDPCSAKNRRLPPLAARAILQQCGLAQPPDGTAPHEAGISVDGALVRRRCQVLREGAPPRLDDERIVVSLARWDRLKDPVGIMRGFAEHVREPRARLIVAGPAVSAVADDPQGPRVLREARACWRGLPVSQRARIDLAALPMADLEENALIVNALQRVAAVVVKKSLQEGFGLGVTEALWKARPVVASRVGGHQEQIEDRRTGLFVDDPTDLAAFGAAISELLRDPATAVELGAAGREHVREHFLADRHFRGWTRLLGELGESPASRREAI